MDKNVIEFEFSGCIYTDDKSFTLDDFVEQFNDFCDGKGWEFCGCLSEPKINNEDATICTN